MFYAVDDGSGRFVIFDTAAEALECAENALQSARDFRQRMGFTPFWGKAVEIRKGRGGYPPYVHGGNEAYNQEVVRRTLQFRTLSVEENP